MRTDADCPTRGDVFHCTNSTSCFDFVYRCDGSADCADNSDEEDCGKHVALLMEVVLKMVMMTTTTAMIMMMMMMMMMVVVVVVVAAAVVVVLAVDNLMHR